jgi:hypothetical protein
MPKTTRPRDAYYVVRRQSVGLRRESWRFEGRPWAVAQDGAEERQSCSGWLLRSFYDKNEPVVVVIDASGDAREYA